MSKIPMGMFSHISYKTSIFRARTISRHGLSKKMLNGIASLDVKFQTFLARAYQNNNVHLKPKSQVFRKSECDLDADGIFVDKFR